jgi:hypothetical protein
VEIKASRKLVAVLGIAVAGLATSVVGLTATDASAGAACGRAPASDIDHSAYVTANVNTQIHTGSDINCTAIGLLSAGQRADYYCYTVNQSSGYTWTYLRDVATGKKGWVRDDTLPLVNGTHGSYAYCGF